MSMVASLISLAVTEPNIDRHNFWLLYQDEVVQSLKICFLYIFPIA